jgi:transcriptional regulator with XRE-family HTH domain
MLGEKIKNMRVARGMYQIDLAQALNVSKSTVAMWETDRRTPDIDMLTRIAEFFCVSTNELLNGRKVNVKLDEEESNDEQYILRAFRGLSEKNKKAAVLYLLELYKEQEIARLNNEIDTLKAEMNNIPKR